MGAMKDKIIKQATNALVDVAVNKMTQPKSNAKPKNGPAVEEDSVMTPIVNAAEGFFNRLFPEATPETDVNSKPGNTSSTTKVGNPKEDAVERLAVIAGSLEIEDTHQMIEDIVLLIHSGKKASEAEIMAWVFKLYGKKA